MRVVHASESSALIVKLFQGGRGGGKCRNIIIGHAFRNGRDTGRDGERALEVRRAGPLWDDGCSIESFDDERR